MVFNCFLVCSNVLCNEGNLFFMLINKLSSKVVVFIYGLSDLFFFMCEIVNILFE